MSEPIPAAELAAFREVVNAATRGPWVERVDSYSTDIVDTSGDVVVVGKYTGLFGDDFDTMTPGNRKLIAQSREMCGRLLDEVDRLQIEVENLQCDLSRERDQVMSHLRHRRELDCVIGGTMTSTQMARDCDERWVAEKFEALRLENERLKAALAAKGGG